MVRRETPADLDREEKAIKLFCDSHQLAYKKLGEFEIDFKVYKNEEFYAWVEVKGRNKAVADAFPLPIAARKMVKLIDCPTKGNEKTLVLWACLDGILVFDARTLQGSAIVGGRTARDGASNDVELMLYYGRNLKGNIYLYKTDVTN